MIKKKEDWIYWTDSVAQEVKKRVQSDPLLKKIVKERGYIVNDAKTPSGKIHIGSARGWVIHDMIAKSMRQNGMNAKFILGNDDMDPLDGLPPDLDNEEFRKHMGKPLIHVPSPVSGYDNYADYFFRQCVEKFKDFNIEAETYRTSELYISGKFNDMIRKVLDNAQKIQDIYQKKYGKTVGARRLPFTPICEKCGKIGTTAAYEWDSKKGVVKYKCEPDLVDWSKGCGYEGEISPFDGNGKMPYKVEWPCKWVVLGVIAESGGKDHFTKTGSRAISVDIACNIFGFTPPWPSTCSEIGRGYEFFLLGGAKMSTSKGVGASFAELAEMVSPEILRFLMVKTRPETTIDFSPEGDTIPFLFNEFDKIERIYFGLDEVSEREKVNAKRVYELSVTSKIPESKPYRVPFDFASMLVQILPKEDMLERVIKMLKNTGHIKSLTELEVDILKSTLRYARIWIENFAPDRSKISIMNEIPTIDIEESEKKALNELGNFLSSDRTDDEIWDKIRGASENAGIKPQKLFKAAYKVLIGKDYGPRLVPFIQSLDREFVRKRFMLKA